MQAEDAAENYNAFMQRYPSTKKEWYCTKLGHLLKAQDLLMHVSSRVQLKGVQCNLGHPESLQLAGQMTFFQSEFYIQALRAVGNRVF